MYDWQGFLERERTKVEEMEELTLQLGKMKLVCEQQ
jgi:hypothetical protein